MALWWPVIASHQRNVAIFCAGKAKSRTYRPSIRKAWTRLNLLRKIIPFHTDRAVFHKCNLQQFVDRLGIPEAIKGKSEQ